MLKLQLKTTIKGLQTLLQINSDYSIRFSYLFKGTTVVIGIFS